MHHSSQIIQRGFVLYQNPFSAVSRTYLHDLQMCIRAKSGGCGHTGINQQPQILPVGHNIQNERLDMVC